MDSWFSVGTAEMHVVFLAFRTTDMEQNASRILETLIAQGQISSNLGFMNLPPGMAIPTERGDWYPVVLGLPLSQDMEALLALYFNQLEQQFGYRPERMTGLSPEVAQTYIDIALFRDKQS